MICPFCGQTLPSDASRCTGCSGVLDTVASANLPDRELSERLLQDLLGLLREGNKIDAIKRYREVTGVGLREAKEAVEAIAGQHGIKSQATGCGSAAVLMIVLATVVSVTLLT